jgi:integration host factor subunit beta
MKKSDLIKILHGRYAHLNARDVEQVVDTVFGALTEALARGDRVELRGFGSFAVSRRDPRMSRNPKTGDPIKLEARAYPSFKAGRELRLLVNRGSSK